MTTLPNSYFLHHDVVHLAKSLVGKWLFSCIDGVQTGGMIIETEAYKGAEDRACHAFQNRQTQRTEVMFQEGGTLYVYLCYGMHNLLNIVTNREGIPHAILIRALHSDTGLETIKKRRKTNKPLTVGPGRVCQALGINRTHNGQLLSKGNIWIEDRGITPLVKTTPRIGVGYAKEDSLLPYRFVLEDKFQKDYTSIS